MQHRTAVAGRLDTTDVSVQCSNHNRKLLLTVSGHPPLTVDLPFMVLAEHATASLQPAATASGTDAGSSSSEKSVQSQQLKLELPMKPCLDILREVGLA